MPQTSKAQMKMRLHLLAHNFYWQFKCVGNRLMVCYYMQNGIVNFCRIRRLRKSFLINFLTVLATIKFSS